MFRQRNLAVRVDAAGRPAGDAARARRALRGARRVPARRRPPRGSRRRRAAAALRGAEAEARRRGPVRRRAQARPAPLSAPDRHRHLGDRRGAARRAPRARGAASAPFPCSLYPVPVQGAGAAREIAAMLALADRRREVDVLLLVRGGGSLEDLWAFNDESARAHDRGARAAADHRHRPRGRFHDRRLRRRPAGADAIRRGGTRRPGRSRLARYASALRRRRLSAAAVRALGRRGDAMQRRGPPTGPAASRPRRVRERMQRLDELQVRALARRAPREHAPAANACCASPPNCGAARPASRLAALRQRTTHAAGAACAGARARLAARAAAACRPRAAELHATSPLATLGRGYAIVTRAADGAVLRDPAQRRPGRRSTRASRADACARACSPAGS